MNKSQPQPNPFDPIMKSIDEAMKMVDNIFKDFEDMFKKFSDGKSETKNDNRSEVSIHTVYTHSPICSWLALLTSFIVGFGFASMMFLLSK